MPDTAMDRPERDLEGRVGRLEEAMRDVRATLARLEPMIVRIDATLPHLATKADLADKPGKLYLWGVLAALIAAYAAGLNRFNRWSQRGLWQDLMSALTAGVEPPQIAMADSTSVRAHRPHRRRARGFWSSDRLGSDQWLVHPPPFSTGRRTNAYRMRNLIERAFCRLKDWRGVATRYDKTARNFLAGVCLAITVIHWLQ